MAEFIAPFDPRAAGAGTISANMPNGGWIFIHNESPVELAFQVGAMGVPVLVPAYVARCFSVKLSVTNIKWQQIAVLDTATVLISQVYGELYDPNEWTGGELYIGLARLTNVGNIVTTATEIVNNGDAAGSNVIESQPSDQGGTSWAMNNDGSGSLRVISANVLRSVLNIVRGNFASQKAVVQIGDSSDETITTYYGQLDKISSDAGEITSDGAGDLAATRLTGTTQVTAGKISSDGGKVTTDGAGTVTINTGYANVTAPDSIGQPPLSLFLPTAPVAIHGLFSGRVTGDSISRVGFQIRSDGFGSLILGNAGASSFHIWGSSTGINTDGAIAQVASVATAGSYGVATVLAVVKDLSVGSNVLQGIISMILPNVGSTIRLRISFCFNVDGLNNGVITAYASYIDGAAGVPSGNQYFDTYHGTSLNGATITKSGIFNYTKPLEIEARANTVIGVSYQNSATGGIGDLVTCVIEAIA